MAKKLLIFTVLVFSFAFASCKSNEEKAADRIRTELSKTLLDFESYEPIETTVTEASETAYSNLACIRLSETIAAKISHANELLKESEDALDYMRIWGPPTRYSSSYSDSQFYKYQEKCKILIDEAMAEKAEWIRLGLALQDSIAKLDSTKVIGWEVLHRFRCKTKAGLPAICDYRYILSPDFKNIILRQDMDDENYTLARGYIQMAMLGEFSANPDEDASN